jgi:hypothetical protein
MCQNVYGACTWSLPQCRVCVTTTAFMTSQLAACLSAIMKLVVLLVVTNLHLSMKFFRRKVPSMFKHASVQTN